VSSLLRSYALSQSDLPSGYTTGIVVEVPNDSALSGYDDEKAARQEMEEVARQGGIGQQLFPPGNVAASMGVSIEVFKDAAGAKRWASNPPSLPAGLNPTAADPQEQIGDAISATHWTQGGQSGYVLSFSRGRVVFGIGVSAPTGHESLTPALDVAQKLNQKAQRQSN
jgi:hypothetical protein